MCERALAVHAARDLIPAVGIMSKRDQGYEAEKNRAAPLSLREEPDKRRAHFALERF
jgi:hypothetical protein